MASNLSYSDRVTSILEGGISTNVVNPKSSSIGDPLDNWDIAQSHFFTVQIYSKPYEGGKNYAKATGLHDINGNPFNFASGQGTYKDYLPIKSMNFSYTSYDNMSIPLAVLGDFPLLHRKKVSTINFSCYDMDQDVIESALRYWEKQCFPEDKYVEYLDNIKAKLTYRSYDVTGKLTFERILEVIPTSSVSVSRSYEENGAKLLNFSVIAVGYPGASGRVSSGGIIRERGYGDGNEYADLVYEKQVGAAILVNGRPINQTTANYTSDL